MKSKIWKFSIALIIGFIIFILALNFIGIGEILQNILTLNLPLYLLAIGCIFCSILSWTIRWKFFIEANGHNTSTSSLFKNLLVGLSINNLTPLGRFGGEPIRAYLLKKNNGIRMREGLASVLAELTILFIVTMSFIILSIVLIPLVMTPPKWMYIIILPFGGLTALALSGIIGIYSGRDIIIRLIKWFGKKIDRLQPYKEKAIKRYIEFQKIFKKSLKNKKAFSGAITSSLIAKGFNIAKFLLIFSALGFQISFLKLFIGMGITLIILSIPTTPGSLGVYESGFISVFVLLGVPAQIAATAIFLDRLIWFWGITIIGGSLGTYYGIDIWESQKAKTLKT